MSALMNCRRVSRKPILDKEMSSIVLVVCSNLNHFHNAINIRYIYWSYGFSIDEPCYDEVSEVAKEMNQHENWTVIEAKCYSCTHGVPL